MTKSPKQPRERSSRRRTSASALPQLAAQLPKDFRSPTAVNAFIYSLTVEFTAGRVDSRKAAVLGYLSQLAIQTLPLLRIEDDIDREARPFQFITYAPRPEYPASMFNAEDQAAKKAALESLQPQGPADWIRK